jgi:hypothetical protein
VRRSNELLDESFSWTHEGGSDRSVWDEKVRVKDEEILRMGDGESDAEGR